MDTRDGRIYTTEQMGSMSEAIKKFCVPIENPTVEQMWTRRVQLDDLCPCGSRIIFEKCCLQRDIRVGLADMDEKNVGEITIDI